MCDEGLVEPRSDRTGIPPPRSPSAGGVCLLFAIGKGTRGEAGWIASAPVAWSADQCVAAAWEPVKPCSGSHTCVQTRCRKWEKVDVCFSKFKVMSLNVLFTAFTQVLYLSKVLRYLFFTWTSLHYVIEANIVLLSSHLLDNFSFMLLSRLHPACNTFLQ